MPASFQIPRPAERMLPVEEAQRLVLEEVEILGLEKVVFTEALGRILREDVRATYDLPQADNTAMDGYAVRSADVGKATERAPAKLEVIEDLPAGSVAIKSLVEGTAIRIMTGAPIPDGADAVVPVELTDAGDSEVSIHKGVKAAENIRRRGEDMRAGEIVLRSGLLLRAAEVGVLASVQKGLVAVGRRPTVAILSTGDEIVDVDGQLQPGKVINSNSYSLAALVSEAGAIPRMLGIVRDTKAATIDALESALQSDFIISSGGVSVGAYDFVKDALDAMGAETRFWQVAMKPGKPIVVSRLRSRLFFGLPGNPVSCMVSVHLFVAPALRKAMGQTGSLLPPIVTTVIGSGLKSRGDRRHYTRVRVFVKDGQLHSLPMSAQGSGVSTSMVRANGLAIVEAGVTAVGQGSEVPTVLIGPIDAE
ncbi:MAG TPA: gephyrin-like molybdotransferase Glp [Thermoanaerobaculia bacterium]|nr:gephyrin-like molybdotransferase Glp [Thermoanaerobaculia bacterium]